MEDRFGVFTLSVAELNRLLRKIKERKMGELGLQGNHTMCLYYLGAHPEGLTATELVSRCKEDKAAVSRTLARLAEAGLIACDPPGDKRSYRTRYRLTGRGTEIVKEVNARIEDAVFNGGSGLSEEQRAVFYDALDRILRNLTDYLNKEGS